MRRAGLALLSALLCCGCAQVREISGGPKDEEGPILEEASPPSGTVRFAGDRFVMLFDERVQVNRPKGGLLVSPPMDPPPTISVSGAREVTVSWKNELRPNTTYSFAIGEAVQDLSERNPARGLTYALSTGDAVDSLSVTGTVTHAFSGAPVEDALVMAYDAQDTSSFTKGRPMFVTRTSKGGQFALTYLPLPGLRIAALKDLNGNYRFDLPAEEIAFSPAVITPVGRNDSLAEETSLHLFQEASTTQRILSAEVLEDRALRIALALPAERLDLRDVAREGGRLSWSSEWNSMRDTVLLWPSDTTALSEGRFEARTEAATLDTLRYRAIKPMPFALKVKPQPGPATGRMLRLRASRPLSELRAEAIRLQVDSVDMAFTAMKDPNDARRVLIEALDAIPPKAMLTVLPKALRDIYGGAPDTLRLAVGPAPESAFGILRVTLIAYDDIGPCILELLDQGGRIVRRALGVRNGTRVDWERLEPGNHTIRLIVDTNGDGRWNPGRWSLQQQPERVFLHSEPTNVRAGWDLGISWDLRSR